LTAADALATAKIWVDIVSGILTIVAVVVGGWWFLFRRSLDGNLQIQLTHQMTVTVGSKRLATIRINLKNIGQTRIVMRLCELGTEPILVPDDAPAQLVIPIDNVFRMPSRVLPKLAALEPGEELYEDVPIVLAEATLYAVGLRFQGRSITEASWQAIAIVNTSATSTTTLSTPSQA